MALFLASLSLSLVFIPTRWAWAHDGMKLEALVRELGNAHPWTPEKVTEITGVRLESAGSRGDEDMKSATTAVFAEGLTLREIDLRIRSPKLVIGLMVLTVDPLPCMTLERLRKTWPDL
ncbi:MAG: hypothetical protein LBB76_06850, partial [Azoarcus sp.]|nr:hypothetical protein [Azoarcus sp.]